MHVPQLYLRVRWQGTQRGSIPLAKKTTPGSEGHATLKDEDLYWKPILM